MCIGGDTRRMGSVVAVAVAIWSRCVDVGWAGVIAHFHVPHVVKLHSIGAIMVGPCVDRCAVH